MQILGVDAVLVDLAHLDLDLVVLDEVFPCSDRVGRLVEPRRAGRLDELVVSPVALPRGLSLPFRSRLSR